MLNTRQFVLLGGAYVVGTIALVWGFWAHPPDALVTLAWLDGLVLGWLWREHSAWRQRHVPVHRPTR
jgi:hypothetical protein